MRVNRVHPRTRNSTAIVILGLGLGLIAAATPATLSATAATEPTASLPPRAAITNAESVPEPVAPHVTDLAIPPVPKGDRVFTASRLAAPADVDSGHGDDEGTLVAHLRQPSTTDFSMVGVTWAPGTAPTGLSVEARTLRNGTWSDWTHLHFDPEEAPSAAEDSQVRDGTAPVWSGDSTGVEVAVYSSDGSTPADLQLNAIDPGTSSYDAELASEQTSLAAAGASDAGPKAGQFPGKPRTISRARWGADESLGDKCFPPRYGSTFKMVFVHHTVGSNSYSEYESPAVVRGVHAYHTASRGWCDIGYNFLVDRYGNVYEGRDGGIRKSVRGAHAGDYNTNTTGISLMGNFEEAYPTRPMKHALVQLIAWRMGSAYHGAYGRTRVAGDRFKRIAGHRDAMSTACPGVHVYEWLPTLRERVATRLGDYESRIETTWRAKGGHRSDLGSVRIGEQGENRGHHTTFERGRMYGSAAGLFTLYRGPILRKYVRSRETNNLGYPITTTRPVATGRVSAFKRGRIYRSNATGVALLDRHPILRKYRALDGAAGRLGFPMRDAVKTRAGSKVNFQHGTIRWDSTAKRLTVEYR
ncbi:MAG: N-acetylmuramoyl-L-alanine amidase [Nocardioidaceae bacterium]|nr:N-acetylmuramoyl-L-alanine amidase [Nocardioidaceae bacterium]